MSRDDAPVRGPRGDDDALLTAYVDGVGELSPDERRRVEARLHDDPAARQDEAAVRALLVQLRGAEDRSDEPDWGAMERAIHAAVGDDVPRPWWRRWTWLVPAATAAAGAVGLLLMWGRPAPASHAVPDAPAVAAVIPAIPEIPAAPPHAEILPLWLDGAALDVDVAALPPAGALGDGDELDDDGHGDEIVGQRASIDDARLLPPTDLAWVDRLDDDALERAETWLAGQKG